VAARDLESEPKLSILTIIFKVYLRNLEFFGLQIFNSEGRSHEFHIKKLELALIQYIGLRGHNPVVAIYGLVSEIRFTYLQH